MSQGLPSGTVTFLFTDVEGSTWLLKELGRDRYHETLAEHQRILRAAFAAHHGQVVDTQGDSFFVAFATAADAVAAAVDAQRGLAAHSWPEGNELKVRAGLHTGEPKVGTERYVGIGVHRAARIGAAGHGGQVLLSNTTRELVEDDLPADVRAHDLGTYRLKDLDRPEHLFQLDVDGLPSEFPPLKAEKLVASHPLRRRSLLAAGLMGVIAAAVAIPIFAWGQGESGVKSIDAAAGNSAGFIDPVSNRLVANVDVGSTPTGVAVGAGAVWVTNASDGTVTRIDPATRTVRQTIRVGSAPSGIAVGGGAAWVVNSRDGTVSRIDPDTNDVVDTIPVGNGPAGITVGAGAVWVGNSHDQTVTRIDAKTGEPTHTFDVEAPPTDLAAAPGTLWMTSAQSRTVSRIDSESRTVVATIDVGGGPTGIAVAGDAVWVANSLDGTVTRISAASNTVTATLEVGNGPVSIAAVPGAVWVSNESGGTLSRIDPGTNLPVGTVPVGNRPFGIALAGDSLWVAVRATGAAHRGGTLRVASDVGPESIDPAIPTNLVWLSFLSITGDGLTGLKRAGGSDGNQLVPDLAVSLPTPTNGGKSYTFKLRRGIRYSTGATVQPRDVRASIERLFRVGEVGSFSASVFDGIVGAARCAKSRNACDLSRGIVADSASRAVTFHLTAPDPEFLYKLALPYAYILPAATPPRPAGTRPLPATGPYRISAYRPDHLLTLVRNPRFREWSQAAQPDGYSDRIEVRFDLSPDEAVNAVLRGRADEYGGITRFPAGRLDEVTTRYAGQVHSYDRPATLILFLNTRVPPFDDPRARRAVAYAVDRAALVEAHGGPRAARATCQILPPNFPGYRPYCPFARPDVALARQLVAASGTKGMRVTVWGWKPPQVIQARYVASLLRRLGYRVSLRLGDDFGFAANSRNGVHIGTGGWFADYPAASNFFQHLLTCRSYIAASTANNNWGGFCDPSIDAAIGRALARQATNPQAANELWARIDRRVTDAAPWVPLFTPIGTDLISKRVGNYQFHPTLGPLFGQFWVR